MPRRRVHKRKLGGSWSNFVSGAKNFLKKSKLLSTVGSQLNKTFVPQSYRGIGNSVVNYVKKCHFYNLHAYVPWRRQTILEHTFFGLIKFYNQFNFCYILIVNLKQ